jgi:hypothetical protein
MRAIIVPADKLVIVDGIPANGVNAEYPQGVHAIQWFGENGFIEFEGSPKPPNEVITDFSPYQPILDAYNVRIAEIEAERLAMIEGA